MIGFIWIFLIVFVSSLFLAALPIGYYVIWFDSKPIVEWSLYLLPPLAISIIWTGLVAAIWLGLYFTISTNLQDTE